MQFTPLSVSVLTAVLCQTSTAAITNNVPAPVATLKLSQPSLSPQLMLAKRYQGNIDLQHYWISEKLDGVRAYWNGHQLISRQGYPIHAPLWFVQALPKTPLDGELWSGRGQFEALSASTRRYQPIDAEWQKIQYRLFDLPASLLPFKQRIDQLEILAQQIGVGHIQTLSYSQVSTHDELLQLLQQQAATGAEGLILNRIDASYEGKRSDALLKLKLHLDDEARVVAHLPGKGKYRGLLGAIEVQLTNGQRFKIGSGFTDQQRAYPPAIGSTITFKYFGMTDKGKPRFASFVRNYEPTY
tara:strand:- start:5181 stop:6077 length:897 start_codon:yes stop_codon:yes gene_type:complete